MKRRSIRVGTLSVVVLGLALTACSSTNAAGNSKAGTASNASTSTSGTDSSASTSNGASTIAYDGPERNLPTIKVPSIKPGTHCSIGYQTIIASVPGQKAQADAAGVEAKRLGCSYKALDDMVNPTQQVNNFNQLVAQKVDAILIFPIVSKALTPSLATAKAAGITVIGQSAPIAADSPAIPGYATDGLQMSDTEAYLRVKSVAAAHPGATFVEMGLAAPVELLQYYAARTKYWAAKFGLKYLGQIDAANDNPQGYSQATTAIVGKYPGLQALFCFGDNAAVGAAAVLQTSGKKNVLVSGGDGSKEALTAIQNGTVFNTPHPDFLLHAKLMVDAAYDVITKQNLPLPEKFGVPVVLVDKANAATVTPVG